MISSSRLTRACSSENDLLVSSVPENDLFISSEPRLVDTRRSFSGEHSMAKTRLGDRSLVKYLLLGGLLVLEIPEAGIGVVGRGKSSLVTVEAHW